MRGDDMYADVPLDGAIGGAGGGLPLGPLYQIPEGFADVGYISDGGIEINYDDAPDVAAWGGKTISTRQARQTAMLTFPFNYGGLPAPRRTAADRLRGRSSIDDSYAVAMKLVFGIDVRPARPTVGEAFVDLWDALRALVLIVGAVLSERLRWPVIVAYVRRAGWAVVEGVLDRWDVLRTWPYRRTSGPVVRVWNASMVHVYTFPVLRESWRAWARRQLSLFGAVWRG
ncbi:hypothetical protein I5H01_gp018 [Mycobacterium phage MarkPhew]|uniref:Uncharacterized protein n=1 Tax=Mycobacterium phage MarkPhew TaxID=2725625 RepID=A0A6M3SXN5_9CAUD|nr:hypothetical protein I5H01_gp018 [Mycobacterium phage MarkPhew]QJD50389.1 hypothetical protein SEA_MARKPHEW_89 [Mycobacterium phage MarkPhew]